LSSALQAAIILMLDKASAATPEASLSMTWTSAYLFTTSGVMIAYQTTTAISPLEVTKVSSQLKEQPMMRAMRITDTACIREESRSEIPNCRMFAVIVIIAVVCPGGSASNVEIGSRNNDSRYFNRTAADIRRLVTRKPIDTRSVRVGQH
jgi:hypothetical protein